MYKKSIIASLMTLAATSSFAATSCGKVEIADMNWNSASLMANIDKFILTNGYGCDAELIPGDTMPTSTSMAEKGQPDIAPELWTNAVEALINRGVEDGTLSVAGKSLSDGGEEGFWVPKYMVDENPELATISGIKKYAKDFPSSEDPSVSAFYGCPAGWACQITGGNLFKAMNLEEAGFELIDPGSSAGLSGSLSRAYEREESWFGYYWAPTAILGKYDMVKVDFESGVDAEHYKGCISEESCMDPQVTMFPPSPVYTVTTANFKKSNPEAYQYTTQRSLTNDQMNMLLAWMEDNQADGQYAAENFMFTYPEIWSKWVNKDVKAKIDNALDSL